MAQTKEEKHAEWMKGRPRPTQVRVQSIDDTKLRSGDFQPKPGSVVDANHINVKVGDCPCATCGHTYMFECDPEDGKPGCACCSRFCT